MKPQHSYASGNFDAAESKYLEALAMKITDEQSEHVERTKRALYENRRLVETQKMFEDALINPGCKLLFPILQKQIMYSADKLVGELDRVFRLIAYVWISGSELFGIGGVLVQCFRTFEPSGLNHGMIRLKFSC